MEPKEYLNKKIGISFGVVVICAVLAVTIFEEMKNNNVATNASVTSPVATPVTTTTVSQTTTTVTTNSAYKDGTYSASGSYMSPGGEDSVQVTLTLKNDDITSINTTASAGDGTSRRYQSSFLSGYKQYVIGKNIADINLTSISGSSLTPIGFDEALTQIKAEAKA